MKATGRILNHISKKIDPPEKLAIEAPSLHIVALIDLKSYNSPSAPFNTRLIRAFKLDFERGIDVACRLGYELIIPRPV